MKPSWVESPVWENYLAMDIDGEWSWYEEEPNRLWQHGVWVGAGSYQLALVSVDGVVKEWANTLEIRS